MPSSSAGGRCPCGEVLRATRDADHALVCPKNSGIRTLRHDHLNRVWCGAVRCAGVATAVEPKLRALQMQPGVRRHAQAREEARGDALLAMPKGMLVLDVNIVHQHAFRHGHQRVAARFFACLRMAEGGGYSNRVMMHCKQVSWQSTRSSSQHLHARSAHFFGGPI